jgi:hypothetical protein
MIWLPIENVWDTKICKRTVRQLYAILEMHHGVGGAQQLWLLEANDGLAAWTQSVLDSSTEFKKREQEWDAQKKAWREEHQAEKSMRARTEHVGQYPDHEGCRLALEYYSMPVPKKKTLARKLAKANETLPKERRYGTNGSTSEMTMLQQITRALKGTRGSPSAKKTKAPASFPLPWNTLSPSAK